MGVVRDNLRAAGCEALSMMRNASAWILALTGVIALLGGWGWWMWSMTLSGYMYSVGLFLAGIALLWISTKIDQRPVDAMSKAVDPMRDPKKHSSNDSKPGI
jgi:hypothetical protein